jgi:hypothetical protein
VSAREGPAVTVLGATWPYFATKSPIFSLRNAVGILFTLISIRVRKPWAWSMYCARSFLARSVTGETSALLRILPEAFTDPLAASYQSEPAFVQA